MNLAEPILKMFRKSSVPEVEVGDVVRVHQKIREGNKERIQVFEGIVIAMHKRGSLDATFTVRKIASGVGVERVYLLHSPNVTKIEFKRSSNVRRSKLYYLRALTGKALKMKDRAVTKSKWEELVADESAQTEATEEDVAEAVAEDERKQAEVAEAGVESGEGEIIEAGEETAVGETNNEMPNNEESTPTETSETGSSKEGGESADSGDGADTESSGN
jgi:large subunit ribosomal protein L19